MFLIAAAVPLPSPLATALLREGTAKHNERLNETLFTSPAHAKATLAKWRSDRNRVRPHRARGGATPAGIGMRPAPP